MATESFLVATLPRTADAAESVHVSLFVTHRLTPDGASGELRDFPRVESWTNRLQNAEIQLTGRKAGGATVQIPITAVLGVLQWGETEAYLKWMVAAMVVQGGTLGLLLLDIKR